MSAVDRHDYNYDARVTGLLGGIGVAVIWTEKVRQTTSLLATRTWPFTTNHVDLSGLIKYRHS